MKDLDKSILKAHAPGFLLESVNEDEVQIDEEAEELKKLTPELEKLRKKVGVESDTGIFLGIVRDIAQHIRRGRDISKLMKELKDFEKELQQS